ncbi:ribonuclease HII [Thiomicrospira aerophila AL3]|uniref:Ribonuclease HII n=1 Tax=Thiomicrospira aerophila AL3 TaxID=717772 RepID=W0DRK6_9GAMM|nr:ribonuclease HII [Thiomicrospira aerophila]AHF01082.1 ribonuclease HII [Thiomicrospira aerophila AL3]
MAQTQPTLARIILTAEQYPTSVGVDEVGRGPLVGEVVAAAVVLPADHGLVLADSKKLSVTKREALAEQIKAVALDYAIVGATPAQIDQLNILQATLWAMSQAVEQLKTSFKQVYVDGNRCPALNEPCQPVIKGDARLDIISAASIIAKVYRDQQMDLLHQRHPDYGFAQHKGYPTAAHLAALEKYGPLAEHRRSFKPVQSVLKLR